MGAGGEGCSLGCCDRVGRHREQGGYQGSQAGWGRQGPACAGGAPMEPRVLVLGTGGTQPILAPVPKCHQVCPAYPMPHTAPIRLRSPQCPQDTTSPQGPPMSPCSLAPGVPGSSGTHRRYWGAGVPTDPRIPSPCVTAVPSSLYTGGTLLVAFSTPGETPGAPGAPALWGPSGDTLVPTHPHVPSAGSAALPGHVHAVGGRNAPHPHQHAGGFPAP